MPPLSRTSTLRDIVAWLEQYEGPGGLSQSGITWKKPVLATLTAYIQNNDDVLPDFAPFAKAVFSEGPHVEAVKAFKATLRNRIQGQWKKGVEQKRDSGELHAAIGKLHSLAIRFSLTPSEASPSGQLSSPSGQPASPWSLVKTSGSPNRPKSTRAEADQSLHTWCELWHHARTRYGATAT